MKPAKMFVTGATGALGRKIIDAFLDEYEVIGIVHSYLNPQCERLKKIIPVYTLSDITKKPYSASDNDILIHCATAYGRNNETISQIIETNILFGIDVINFCTCAKIKKIINVTSSLPSKTSPYSLSKKQFSEWLDLLFGGAAVNVLLEQFYSETADKKNFVNMIIEKCLKNESIELTDCTQIRDLIHVDDVIQGLRIILKKGFMNMRNEYALGSGVGVMLKDAVDYIKVITNSGSVLQYGKIPKRKDEPAKCIANIEALTKLGYKPVYNYKNGLSDIVKKIQGGVKI